MATLPAQNGTPKTTTFGGGMAYAVPRIKGLSEGGKTGAPSPDSPAMPNTGSYRAGLRRPQTGFEAYVDEQMGLAGGRKVSGGDNKTGSVFTSGPYKGMTKGQAYEKMRENYAGMESSQNRFGGDQEFSRFANKNGLNPGKGSGKSREYYETRAQMGDVRSDMDRSRIAQYEQNRSNQVAGSIRDALGISKSGDTPGKTDPPEPATAPAASPSPATSSPAPVVAGGGSDPATSKPKPDLGFKFGQNKFGAGYASRTRSPGSGRGTINGTPVEQMFPDPQNSTAAASGSSKSKKKTSMNPGSNRIAGYWNN